MQQKAEFKHAFAVGDLVEWTSHVAGSRVTKRGRVVEVVPVKGRPKTLSGDGERRKRNHESYVVEVGTPLKRGGVKLTRFWPARAHLKPDSKVDPAKGAAKPLPPSSPESGASYIARNHLLG